MALAAIFEIRSSADLTSVSISGFTAQGLNLALLALLFGALATGIGAATGTSRPAVFGITTGLGVATYALNGLVPQIDVDWLRTLTPFHYYIGGHPLTNGFQPTDALVLAAAAAVILAVAAWRSVGVTSMVDGDIGDHDRSEPPHARTRRSAHAQGDFRLCGRVRPG